MNNFAGESRYQVWELGRNLSTHLHYYLAQFILPQTWSELAFIAVAKGPGSFTGTRIGVVTARTLAQQFDTPLFAISNLAILAWSNVSGLAAIDSDTLIAVEIPARSGEVFAASYQVAQSGLGLAPVLSDTVLAVDKWQHLLNDWSTTGHLVRAKGELSAEVACKVLLELAYQCWQHGDRPHWLEALPFYD